MHAFLAALLMTSQPAPPGEDVRALYYAPSETSEAEASFNLDGLPSAGIFSLAAYLAAVEQSLNGCISMRTEMSSLIETDFGSYAVHPSWLPTYQSCLLARDAEVKALGRALNERRPALLDGLEGEDAVRVTDALARLTIYRTRIKKQVADELDVQGTFVARYNAGGGAGTPGSDIE